MMTKDDRELVEATQADLDRAARFFNEGGPAHADLAREFAATRLEALQAQPVGEEFTDFDPTHCDSLAAVVAEGRAALTASPPVVEREAMRDALRAFARRLDGVPDDTPDIAYLGVEMTHGEGRSVRDAIDAILALTPVEGVGEAVGWQHAIMCPIKHEKRWIYALYPTEDDARRSGQRHDPNTGALIEDAADVRPLYATLSTPVGQGDEVRDALAEASGWMQGNHDEGCALDPEYGSGGGKCTCGLDEAMTRVNAALATLTKGARNAG
jgi:hypothetical protein